MHATFEVFPSGKGWSLLFGKPLLQDFEAVQDYKRDTLHIQHGNSWATLSNQCGEIESSEEDSGGAETPPSRQVQPTSRTREPVNKQTSFTLYMPTEERKQHNVARHRANVVSGLGLSWRRELRDTAYEDELSERLDARPINGGINCNGYGIIHYPLHLSSNIYIYKYFHYIYLKQGILYTCIYSAAMVIAVCG